MSCGNIPDVCSTGSLILGQRIRRMRFSCFSSVSSYECQTNNLNRHSGCSRGFFLLFLVLIYVTVLTWNRHNSFFTHPFSHLIYNYAQTLYNSDMVISVLMQCNCIIHKLMRNVCVLSLSSHSLSNNWAQHVSFLEIWLLCLWRLLHIWHTYLICTHVINNIAVAAVQNS